MLKKDNSAELLEENSRKKCIVTHATHDLSCFQKIMDSVPSLISYVDTNCRYVLVNKTYEQWFYRGIDEIEGRYLRDILGETEWEDLEPYFEKALAGENANCERLFQDPSGNKKWVHVSIIPDHDIDDTIKGLIVHVNDITNIKQKEEALRNSEREFRKAEERYKNIIMDQTELVCRLLADGTIMFVNPAFCKMAEMEESEILGKSFNYFVDEQHVPRVIELMKEVTPTDPDRSVELMVHAKEKSYWMQWNGRTLFDSEGNINEFQVVGRDITDRIRIEADLINKTKDLENINKELESFSYSISHDLREPLAMLKLMSDILFTFDQVKSDKDLMDIANHIKKNSAQMDDLIKAILNLSRASRQELNRSLIDMKAIVTETWKELGSLSPLHKYELQLKSLPSVMGDPVLLKQVITNILSNAVKFSGRRRRPLIEVGGYKEKGLHTFYVRDNGAGFDMKRYDQLFSVFQRLHQESMFQGTGIGLALVKKIVDRHGGRIWAQGKINRGATFFFSIPMK